MKIAITLAAAALALAPTSAFAASNIVTNGGFEDGINAGSFTTVNAFDTTSITGWTVATGSVDYIGTYWQNHNNSGNSVDLAGNSNGSILQALTTVIGQAYELTFWISRNPDGGTTPRTGIVDYNGSPTVFTYVNASNTGSNMMWEQVSYVFTATSALTNLVFAQDPTTSGGFYGIALDDVSVTATPEPATWLMLILGFGLAGGAVRNARRRKAGMFA